MNARDALLKLIEWATRDHLYYGVFSATTASVSSGDTVDLTVADPRLSGVGLQGVPISYGLPDCKATIPPGVAMLLFFENGDKKKPRAGLFDGSAIDIQLGGGQLPVARVGDAVVVTHPVDGPLNGIIAGGAAKTKAG